MPAHIIHRTDLHSRQLDQQTVNRPVTPMPLANAVHQECDPWKGVKTGANRCRQEILTAFTREPLRWEALRSFTDSCGFHTSVALIHSATCRRSRCYGSLLAGKLQQVIENVPARRESVGRMLSTWQASTLILAFCDAVDLGVLDRLSSAV
jgi:hypothetical protein